jgi:hypothetical protein
MAANNHGSQLTRDTWCICNSFEEISHQRLVIAVKTKAVTNDGQILDGII